jgi:endonuclease/exonuclease/phosphatase family metal-dependent hydrolase
VAARASAIFNLERHDKMNILTWNVQWCCGMDGLVSVERIVRHALQMGEQAGGLDVLCLQEIAVNYPDLQGRPGDQPAELKALLPGWQIFFGASVDEFTSRGHQRFGNLIATRLPAGSALSAAHAGRGRYALHAAHVFCGHGR